MRHFYSIKRSFMYLQFLVVPCNKCRALRGGVPFSISPINVGYKSRSQKHEKSETKGSKNANDLETFVLTHLQNVNNNYVVFSNVSTNQAKSQTTKGSRVARFLQPLVAKFTRKIANTNLT